jgi:hypothetical protein
MKIEFGLLIKNNSEFQGISEKDAENLFLSLASGIGDRMGIDLNTFLKFCSFHKED